MPYRLTHDEGIWYVHQGSLLVFSGTKQEVEDFLDWQQNKAA